MKRIFLSIIITTFLFVGTISAQTPKWVSTEVQNRTAVFEDYIYVNFYVGMADKMANDFEKQYPNQFITINNNLDIDEGREIFHNSGIDGNIPNVLEEGSPYLLGSINRSTIPWAIGIDKWQPLVENIVNQPSVVNVYVKPELNIVTRELTVEVEYYYTDDSPAPENYLTVMLLQNELLIKDDLLIKYNPDPDFVTEDGLYRRMHFLRAVLSPGGAWGDTITNTKKGSYECRKYTVILPDTIKKIPVELDNLEVAAFISENKANIYSGHKANIEIIKTDVKIEDITEYTLNVENIYPKFKVTNKSDLPITKFDMGCNFILTYTKFMWHIIEYDYFYNIARKQNHDTTITEKLTYLGTLNKDESAIIEFPKVTRDEFKFASSYTLQAFVSSIVFSGNNPALDTNKTDNIIVTAPKIGLIDTSFSETVITFEKPIASASSNILPAHTVLDDSFNHYFSLANGRDNSGANNSNNTVIFLLRSQFNVKDAPGYIMFGEVDCKDNPNKILSYYYAYSDAKLNGTPPRIITEISKDWGQTWEKVSEITCEETERPYNTEIYRPQSNDYKFVQVNLYDYIKENFIKNFIIRIGGVPGTDGNALWIDEISLTNGPYDGNDDDESIDENTKLTVYPNPTTSILHINNNNLLGEEYEIYDMSGKLIIKDINNSNIINVGNLSTGTYSLKIKYNIFTFVKK